MNLNEKRKMLMGIGSFMIPIPGKVAAMGLEKGLEGIKARAALLSTEEQQIHHFIVRKMAVVTEPITAQLVSEELGMDLEMVVNTIDKLEDMKTFVYRSDGPGIDWAYPLSLDNTGHRMTASTGERFFAA
jgi:hypothetical protein